MERTRSYAGLNPLMLFGRHVFDGTLSELGPGDYRDAFLYCEARARDFGSRRPNHRSRNGEKYYSLWSRIIEAEAQRRRVTW